jgi:GT2 family glycosyltransferase
MAEIPETAEYISRKAMRGRFPGSNCAYRRQAILNIGGFDPRFRSHGEDLDLFWRLIDHHSRLLYDPTLVIEHLGFAKDIPTIAQKSFGYGIASAWLAQTHFPTRQYVLAFYWQSWVAAAQEFMHREQPRYPEYVFVDRFMFAIGRTWGKWINKLAAAPTLDRPHPVNQSMGQNDS